MRDSTAWHDNALVRDLVVRDCDGHDDGLLVRFGVGKPLEFVQLT